jgi:DNA-binding NarL/FixJ family response regulator
VSPATVRNHVQKILDKLGVHSRLEAVAYARTNRLI